MDGMENHSDANRHRVVAYFDVDCFYAQAEVLKRPHLQGRPVGVTQKFLVVTCNYEARQRGVPKMASIQAAKERCPDLLLFNGEDLTPYRVASKNIMSVLGRFGVLEKRGLDEAALDITIEVMKRAASMPNCQVFAGHVVGLRDLNKMGCDSHFDPCSNYYLRVGTQIVSEIRAAVEGETGFRCSSGIATNKMLAKLVSSVNKPNQQTCIVESAVSEFLSPLSVRKLPGIGHQTEMLLKDMGITTVADLQCSTLQQLSTKFGNRLGTFLFDSCRGVDKTAVQDKGPPKSLSVEDSFQPCTSYKQAEGIIRSLAPDLIARLDEDKDEYSRRPKIFSIKWRYPGNWAFRSASATMPLEIISESMSMEKRLETVVEVAMKLLSQSLGRQSFSIVVLNIGAASFMASSNGNMAASHDIRSFLNSPLQSPQKTLQKVVSKREARITREETEKGGLSIMLALSVPKNSDDNGAHQNYDVQIHDFTTLSDEDVSELNSNKDGHPWNLAKVCSFKKQPFEELGEVLPGATSCATSHLLRKDKDPSTEVSEVALCGSSGMGDVTLDIRETGSLVERIDESVTADVDSQGDLQNTLVDMISVQDFERFICELCGQEVQRDGQSEQEHDDYHYALKLDSQEQRFETLATCEPTRSSQMSRKIVLGHESQHKRARTQKQKKRSQCGTLDSFFYRSQG